MRSIHLAASEPIILNFVILNHRVFLYDDFRHLVGKTFTDSQCCISFYKLYLGIFTDINESPWLWQDIRSPGVGDIINVDRMLYKRSGFYMDKNTFLQKGSVQCVDAILDILAAMPEVLLNNIFEFIFRGFFQAQYG